MSFELDTNCPIGPECRLTPNGADLTTLLGTDIMGQLAQAGASPTEESGSAGPSASGPMQFEDWLHNDWIDSLLSQQQTTGQCLGSVLDLVRIYPTLVPTSGTY